MTTTAEYLEISLTQGQVALVSAADFEDLSRFKWHAAWRRSSNGFYAFRKSKKVSGKKAYIAMHREIMGNPVGIQIDHVNGNTLDNRRENLRLATASENQRNSRKRSTNSSGFKGVSWNKRTSLWIAQITVNYSNIYLGYYDTPEAAHSAYCEAAEKYHGHFRRTA